MRCKQFISIHILTVILNWVFVILYRMQNEDILNYPIIFVIIGLSTMVITEILSLLIPNAPRLFFGNKKAKAFRKFIKENIKDGMTVKQCDLIVSEKNNNMSKNETIYELVVLKTTTLHKIFLRTSLYKETMPEIKVVLIIVAILEEFLYGLLGPMLPIELGGIIPIANAALIFFAFIFDLYGVSNIELTENSQEYDYCPSCEKILINSSYKNILIKHEDADFSSPWAKRETSYADKRVGSITSYDDNGDESKIYLYTNAPDKTTITAKSYDTYRKICPFCSGSFETRSSREEKKVVNHI